MAAPTLLDYGPGNVDDDLTYSWSNLMPGILDNVFSENTALGWFYTKAKKKKAGGVSLSHAIRSSASTSGGSYSGYQQLDPTPQNTHTRDQWNWKQHFWSVN